MTTYYDSCGGPQGMLGALAALLRPAGYDYRALPPEERAKALGLARSAAVELPPFRPDRR